MLGAVAPLIQGDVPPPLIEVFSADEVKTALITMIVALIGTITALMLYLKAKFDKQNHDLAAVKDQTVNTHGPDGKNDNLRDQLDRMERKQDEGLARLDRKIDKSSGETRRDIQLIRESAIEDHSRIWDELSTKKDE